MMTCRKPVAVSKEIARGDHPKEIGPPLLRYLEEHDRGSADELRRNHPEATATGFDPDAVGFASTDDAIEELFERLSDLAPDDATFGNHPCLEVTVFGYWPIDVVFA